MTGAQMCSIIRQYVLPNDDTSEDTRIVQKMNLALLQVSSLIPQRVTEKQLVWTGVSTSNSTTTSLSTALYITGVRNDTDAIELKQLTPHEFAGYPTNTGQITHFMRYGLYLHFYPTPSATTTLNVRYFDMPAEAANNATELDIDEHCQNAVVLGAAYMFLRSRNENERSGVAFQQYQAELDRIRSLHARQYEVHGGLAKLSYF